MLLKFGKLKVYLPDEEPYIYYATFFAGEWDPLKVIEGDVVIDAGASIGDFTLKVAEKAKKVIAIEPNPVYLDYLKKNVKENGLEDKVVIMPYAIYERNGKVKFSVKGVGSKVGEGEVEVVGMPFDEIVKMAGESNIDVIKMDIEGAESFVINSKTFFNVREIGIELHGKDNVTLFLERLREMGFLVREFDRKSLVRNTVRNILYHPISFLKAESETNFIF